MAVDPTNYRSLFLDPANPLIWGMGEIAFPRNRDCPHVNSGPQIKQGYRFEWPRFDEDAEHVVYFREGLKRISGGTLKWHLTTEAGKGKRKAKYVLATYDDWVQFIPFDIDCHPKAVGERASTLLCDPEALDEAINHFTSRCQEVNAIFTHLGLKTMWYRSPGNIFNDKHVRGVNGVILLDRPEVKQQLAEYCRALQDLYGLQDIEFTWLTNKLFRLPFQRHMCLCDPDTLMPLYGSDPSCRYSDFANGCQHLNALVEQGQLTDAKILREEWRKWREARTAAKAVPTPTVAALPLARAVRIARPSDEELRQDKDTFRAATVSRLCSRITIQCRGDMRFFETAVDDAKAELKRIRPADSNTCSNPKLLDSTVRRWLKWYFRNYDPGRTTAHHERDRADKVRMAYCLHMDAKVILRAIGTRLSYKEKVQFTTFWRKAQEYVGRVSAKALYAESKALYEKQTWIRLKRRLLNTVIIPIDSHDQSKHVCTQWGLAPMLMARIEEQQKLHDHTCALLEEKKEETVYGPQADATIRSELFGTACTVLKPMPKGIRADLMINGRSADDSSWEHCALAGTGCA